MEMIGGRMSGNENMAARLLKDLIGELFAGGRRTSSTTMLQRLVVGFPFILVTLCPILHRHFPEFDVQPGRRWRQAETARSAWHHSHHNRPHVGDEFRANGYFARPPKPPKPIELRSPLSTLTLDECNVYAILRYIVADDNSTTNTS